MSAQPKRPPRQRRPVYAIVRRVADCETGEVFLALRASTKWDRLAMRQRKLHANDEVRLLITKPRNAKFNGLVHAFGKLMGERVDKFSGKDAHAVLKELQRESGAFCDEAELDIPGVGKLLHKQPRSLAFDELDESEFAQFFKQIGRYVCAEYLHDMDEDSLAEAVEMMGDVEP